MRKIPQVFLQTTFFIVTSVQVFCADTHRPLSIAERAKAFQPKVAAPVVLDGKRNPEAVLGASVKKAEANTLNIFTQHYTTAAKDAIYAKRQQVNFYRIKRFQATHTTPAFFDPIHTTGVKAKPENFNPILDAQNIAMAAAYAPYNNCSRVSTEDVEAFARAYPHEVSGINLKALEGELLPPNTSGQAFAYNPFSYGMVLTYRLRKANLLQGEAPEAIDLYNKEQAFAWESAAGIAKESIGTGLAHTAPAPATHPTASSTAPQVSITKEMITDARAKLGSRTMKRVIPSPSQTAAPVA